MAALYDSALVKNPNLAKILSFTLCYQLEI